MMLWVGLDSVGFGLTQTWLRNLTCCTMAPMTLGQATSLSEL